MENICLCYHISYPLTTFKDALISGALMPFKMHRPLQTHVCIYFRLLIKAFRSKSLTMIPLSYILRSDLNNTRCKWGYLLSYPPTSFWWLVYVCACVCARCVHLCSRHPSPQCLFKGIEWYPLWPPLPPLSLTPFVLAFHI